MLTLLGELSASLVIELPAPPGPGRNRPKTFGFWKKSTMGSKKVAGVEDPWGAAAPHTLCLTLSPAPQISIWGAGAPKGQAGGQRGGNPPRIPYSCQFFGLYIRDPQA